MRRRGTVPRHTCGALPEHRGTAGAVSRKEGLKLHSNTSGCRTGAEWSSCSSWLPEIMELVPPSLAGAWGMDPSFPSTSVFLFSALFVSLLICPAQESSEPLQLSSHFPTSFHQPLLPCLQKYNSQDTSCTCYRAPCLHFERCSQKIPPGVSVGGRI